MESQATLQILLEWDQVFEEKCWRHEKAAEGATDTGLAAYKKRKPVYQADSSRLVENPTIRVHLAYLRGSPAIARLVRTLAFAYHDHPSSTISQGHVREGVEPEEWTFENWSRRKNRGD